MVQVVEGGTTQAHVRGAPREAASPAGDAFRWQARLHAAVRFFMP